MGFWHDLFHSYGPYKYVEDITVKEEIYRDRFAKRKLNDPDELESVPTGTYRDVVYEVWVAYHKNSGLPKYKQIKKLPL